MPRYLLVAAIVLFFIAPVRGEFIEPELAPVDRLIRNAEAYIKEHPKEAHGHYVLGRIHYLAWSNKSKFVPAYNYADPDAKGLPNVPARHMTPDLSTQARSQEATQRALKEFGYEQAEDVPQDTRKKFWQRQAEIYRELAKEQWKPEAIDQDAADRHASAAMSRFRHAITLEPNEALYHLSLGSLLEEYADRAAEHLLGVDGRKLKPQDPEAAAKRLRQQWQEAALAQYTTAYELAKAEDLKREHRPISGLAALVSYSAAKRYVAMAQRAEFELKPDRSKAMAEHVATLNDLTIGAITPVIFSFERGRLLDDLIDDSRTVDFDLDGTGRNQRWPWVDGETAILVWDPQETGRITSGRQLFGSATWWLLPGDGFFAMNLLDDDRDGWLRGDELAGLGVWQDANQNGISEPGEVRPIGQTSVSGLSVEAIKRTPEALVNPAGLSLKDGTTLPTWDWIAQPR